MKADRACLPGAVPPPQQNLREASERALEAFRRQPPEALAALGAERDGTRWRLPVLDDVLTVDPADGTVATSDGATVTPWWRILTLHYLSSPAPAADAPPEITFADLTGGRAYAPVYQRRVIERLCRTHPRDKESLAQAARRLGGVPAPGGDLALDLRVYPRIRLRLVWYAGDEELGASAVLLLPRNIEAFLAVEDIVVLSERLISRLAGGGFSPAGGPRTGSIP